MSSRQRILFASLVSVVVLAMAAAIGVRASSPAPAPAPAPASEPRPTTADGATQEPRTDRPPPRINTVPEEPVQVQPGDDVRQLAEDHPAGTTFALAPGVYRQSGVVPRDGQHFIGEPGVVFSGAVLLAPGAFTREQGGPWFIGGQDQEGLAVGEVLPGRERDRHPEEVFVDGDRRLTHVAGRDALEPGTWFFDYARDRIYLHDDPRSFSSVETSVGAFAFGGVGVRDVVIEDIVVEKYASPHYYGALGGSEGSYPTHDWTYRGVTARYNHGAGLAVGPGTVVEGGRYHHNGQIGLVGEGADPFNGYAAEVVVRGAEIDHNLQLGFRWEHEGGGTKFKQMNAGMRFIGNWVHDNSGPGAWWDVYNHALEVRGNLFEHNGDAGLYYEIGYGPALLVDNVSIDNGGAGVQVSTSRDVIVRDNVLWGNGHGLLALHDQAQIGERFQAELGSVVFEDNEVWIQEGTTGIDVFGGDARIYGDVLFRGNRYHPSPDHRLTYRFLGGDVDAATWLAAFPGDGPVSEVSTPHPEHLAQEIRDRVGDQR